MTLSQSIAAPDAATPSDDDATKGERWERFHRANPQVYRWLVEYCRQWARAGHDSFGLRAPWERLRWDLGFRTDGDDFKLNDHYCPFYSRLIAMCEPDLSELLSHRRADEADEVVAAYVARQDAATLPYGSDGASLFDILPTQRDGR